MRAKPTSTAKHMLPVILQEYWLRWRPLRSEEDEVVPREVVLLESLEEGEYFGNRVYEVVN